MNEQEKNDQLQEAKLFAIAAPTLLPLLERRKRIAMEQIISDFRQGKTDLVARAATLSAYAELESELRSREQEFLTLTEKRK